MQTIHQLKAFYFFWLWNDINLSKMNIFLIWNKKIYLKNYFKINLINLNNDWRHTICGVFRFTYYDDRFLEYSSVRIMTAGSALKDKKCIFLLISSLTLMPLLFKAACIHLKPDELWDLELWDHSLKVRRYCRKT